MREAISFIPYFLRATLILKYNVSRTIFSNASCYRASGSFCGNAPYDNWNSFNHTAPMIESNKPLNSSTRVIVSSKHDSFSQTMEARCASRRKHKMNAY